MNAYVFSGLLIFTANSEISFGGSRTDCRDVFDAFAIFLPRSLDLWQGARQNRDRTAGNDVRAMSGRSQGRCQGAMSGCVGSRGLLGRRWAPVGTFGGAAPMPPLKGQRPLRIPLQFGS